jgi:hypothetical protein
MVPSATYQAPPQHHQQQHQVMDAPYISEARRSHQVRSSKGVRLCVKGGGPDVPPPPLRMHVGHVGHDWGRPPAQMVQPALCSECFG